MVTNFEIKDLIYVVQNGRIVDLHNNFDFSQFNHNLEKRRLTLTWKKSQGNWVDSSEFNILKFVHENVDFLLTKQDVNPSVDVCLGEITFFPSDERETNDALIEKSHPEAGFDVLYCFENEQFIRVGCSSIQLICE